MQRPQTYDHLKFREWFHRKFDEQKKRSPKLSLRAVSSQSGVNYSSLYKAVEGDPETYPEHVRMGFDNVLRIGHYFDDVAGAMQAADYPLPGSIIAALESDPTNMESDLVEIVRSWSDISPAMRQPILEMIRAARKPVTRRTALAK